MRSSHNTYSIETNFIYSLQHINKLRAIMYVQCIKMLHGSLYNHNAVQTLLYIHFYPLENCNSTGAIEDFTNTSY